MGEPATVGPDRRQFREHPPHRVDRRRAAADQAKYQQLIINDAATINCELPKVLGVVTAPDPVFTPGNAVGDQAQVSITCGFTLITPMIGTLLPNPLPLTASSVFPVRVGVVDGGGGIPGVGPVANFIADTTSCTAPCTVNFSDQSTGAPTSWTWDFQDDGTADDTNQNPTFVYTTPGLYSVKLTVAHPTTGPTVAHASITSTFNLPLRACRSRTFRVRP